MMLSLYSDSIFTSNELYIRYGDVPTRADFDAQFTNPGRGNQDIILESLVAGTYYIMTYNDVANYNQTVKFLAKIIKFSILSVASNSGGNTGNVTVRINGAKFEPNMTATLFSSTLGTITASRISFINASTIYATFGLIGKSTGTYTVRLRKVNNDTANLTNGFSIVAGIAGSGQIGQTNNSGFYCTITGISADNSIDYGLIYPSTIRIQDAYAIQINFGNNGNVDIPIPSRLLIAENGAPLSYTPLYTVPQEINSNLFLEFKELNGPSDVLRPGATGSITVYSHGRRMVGFLEYFSSSNWFNKNRNEVDMS